MSKKEEKENLEVGEDATQYGEFISTYFAWVPLTDQKEKSEELNKMTKPKENTNSNFQTEAKKSNSKMSNQEERNHDI